MKKILLHIGAHKTATSTLQQTVLKKFPDKFLHYDDYRPSAFDNGFRFLTDEQDPKFLAQLFKRSFSREGQSTLRMSREHLMGRAFSAKGFYPELWRVRKLVEVLNEEGMKVRLLMTTRRRFDFMISLYLQKLSEPNGHRNFQNFENVAVTASYDWRQLAKVLEGLDVTYLPYEAIKLERAIFVAQVNSFFEMEAVTAADLDRVYNPRVNAEGYEVLAKLAEIKNEAARKMLVRYTKTLFRKGKKPHIISEYIRGIYEKHFQDGDQQFARTYFPEGLKHIYHQDKELTPVE
ncbi:hypothetical protein SAMN04488518_108183 [Pseudovibrio ascidiaceicola]|uniref:Sulfotransferase domain-containing protein n=1 Tax=Pseudovibrio ascidiaceicola TaxID=285279 RepID=A0A1I4BXJ5_9HYPH|nr:hypothetical protein [Pseudovibrio ascidiaceicola]SFK72651.1 hypothetical protein SAMN04488518_108183 [Pseudovibrio ascidiaceicola]